MSKGLFMSLITFLLLSTVFSLIFIFSTKNLQLRQIVSKDILSDRIYYKFQTISDSVLEIIENGLGIGGDTNELNVTVDEQPDFSYVTFIIFHSKSFLTKKPTTSQNLWVMILSDAHTGD